MLRAATVTSVHFNGHNPTDNCEVPCDTQSSTVLCTVVLYTVAQHTVPFSGNDHVTTMRPGPTRNQNKSHLLFNETGQTGQEGNSKYVQP